MIGRTVPRGDLEPLHWWEPGVIEVLMRISDVVGRLRPSNHGPAYRTHYRLPIGNNLGVRADPYVAAGGFPRSRIEEVHEDRALMNRMRKVTPRIATERRAWSRRASGACGRTASSGSCAGTWITAVGTARSMSAERRTDPFAPLTGWRHPVLRLADRSVDRWLGVGRWRAAWWETRVWLAANAPLFIGLRVTGRRPVVRLRRFGTLVNDARIGRAILVDAARFRTVGPGTHGALLDQVVGPRALLNMDGPEHEALRRSLHDLFGPEASRTVVEGTARLPLDDVERRLRAGERVDLVRVLRIITGRTSYALLGAPDPPDGDAGYLEAYRQGEELVSIRGREDGLAKSFAGRSGTRSNRPEWAPRGRSRGPRDDCTPPGGGIASRSVQRPGARLVTVSTNLRLAHRNAHLPTRQ